MSIGPAPDLASLIELAAKGDAAAQRAMVDHALAKAVEGEVTFSHAVQVGEAFARLAAAHGDNADLRLLAAMLCYAAQIAQNEERGSDALAYQAEAIALLNTMADAGDEEAARILVAAADSFDAEAVALAASQPSAPKTLQ